MRRPRLIAAILAAAAVLRLAQLGAHGLWWDEFLSVSSACGSVVWEPLAAPGATFTPADFWRGSTPGGVLRAVQAHEGGNAVLYHLLLHPWVRAAGTADVVVRLPSLAFGVLLVLVVHRLAGTLLGPVTALWAAALTALHPLLLRYSQETRAYALATLLAALATLFFVRILREPRGADWAGYGLAGGAALLSHYLTVGVLAGHGVCALLWMRSRHSWLRFLGGGVLAGLPLCAWMAAGGQQALAASQRQNEVFQRRAAEASAAENFAMPATPRNLAAGALQMGLGMGGSTLQSGGLRLSTLAPLLLVPAGLLAAAWSGARQAGTARDLGVLAVLAASGPVTALALALISGHAVSFQVHYGLFATPYLLVLLGAGLAQLRAARGGARAALYALSAAQGTLLVLSLKLVYEDAGRFRPANPHAAAARQIARQAVPGGVVVYPTWLDARRTSLYLPAELPVRGRVEEGSNDPSIRLLRPGAAPLRLRAPQL